VSAEPRTNAVIVRDTAERMPLYQQLIDQLDVEVPLVDIEASVIDISGGKSEQLGIDWRLHGSRLDGAVSPSGLAGGADGTRNAANNLINSGPPLSAGAGLIGTLVLGSQRNYLLSRINALAKSGDAKVTSNPRVLTLDNHEAVLQSTREFYVRVAGRDQVDLFPVSSGLSLRVTPTRVEDARGTRFKLLVRIEDGNTGSGAQVDQIPVVSRNAISTQAVVGDGESLLIGGYVVEERRESQSGVPGLASLPLLGRLLSQRSSEVSRVERLFLITPRLVSPRTPAAALPVAPRTGSPEMAPEEAPEMAPAMAPEVAPLPKPPLPASRWP
jgi:type III secretion protein C